MDNIKLLRMDNFEDDLCGVVCKLTDDEIEYLKKINEFEGMFFVDLMSGYPKQEQFYLFSMVCMKQS